MRRPSRVVAGVCIAAITLAAFVPGVWTFDYALLEPQWVLLPDETLVAAAFGVVPCDEQPAALLTLLPPRAPPLRTRHRDTRPVRPDHRT